jgi:UDP-3-O-[3-hydroxymyristoyl] N-acetylglucosamine deacetylase/3-hydroxyacyl-[acyl-carrier-protein] dehydratase
VTLSGTALFSGQPVNVQILAADAGTGFLFVRKDLPDKPVVPAVLEALTDGFRCTTLSWNEVEVQAVEHILAACTGLQVDNLIVELDGVEMPALDGCAVQYGRALQEAGIVDQSTERPLLRLEDTITVSQNGATIVAMPDDEGLAISYMLDLGGGYGPTEALSVDVTPASFMTELAPARTFGLEEDREEFSRLSLGGGVSDANAIILCRDGTVRAPRSWTRAEMRFPEEPVRHKIVDLLGDMALARVDLAARIVAVRSGHKLNAAFARRLHRLVTQEARPQELLDIVEICRVLPHRYPFLMVDKIIRMEGENKIVGLKNVSVNEHYFQGHYPDRPIMPGVLQIEAMAQTAGVLLLRKLEHAGKLPMLVSLEGVRWRRPVVPGDQLVLEVEAIRVRSRTAIVKARGTVNGEMACEAEMRFMLVDADAV